MIKLTRIAKNEWMLVCHSELVYIAGDILDMKSALVYELGVEQQEFEYAVEDMLLKGHNQADFGINRTFIYSTTVDLAA